MTYPAPMTRRQSLPLHTMEETLELEARRGIHAGLLPSNQGGDLLDGFTGSVHTPEQSMHGWTAQQPFSHVDCPVMHLCIFCAKVIDPDFLRDHQLTGTSPCRVLKELSV